MVCNFIDEIYVVEEANNKIFNKYCNIRKNPKLELRDFKLNKLI